MKEYDGNNSIPNQKSKHRERDPCTDEAHAGSTVSLICCWPSTKDKQSHEDVSPLLWDQSSQQSPMTSFHQWTSTDVRQQAEKIKFPNNTRETENEKGGSNIMWPNLSSLLACCAPVLPRCSPCSLAALSKAALLPFPSRKGIPNPKFGVYIIYIHISLQILQVSQKQ